MRASLHPFAPAALLLAVACAPTIPAEGDSSKGSVAVESDLQTSEEESDADADADTDTDTDTDTDADTDADTDTDPPVALTWSGSRYFEFDAGCEDEVDESGDELEAGSEYHDACSECDHIFYVNVGPSSICDDWGGAPVSTEVIRGVQFVGGDRLVVVGFYPDDRGELVAYELAVGEVDQTTAPIEGEYTYRGAYDRYDFTAYGEFELVAER